MNTPLLRLSLTLFILIALSVGISAQEDGEELPIIPYVSTSGAIEQFNIPVPNGWRNVGTSDLPHLVTSDVEAGIYVVAVGSDELEPGVQTAIEQVIPDFDAEPRSVGELNMDGNIWTQTVYDLDDDTDVTAFSLLRDSVVYSLLYVNEEPSNFYMVATRPGEAGVEVGIAEALDRVFTGFASEPASSTNVELSNGTWLRQSYDDINGEPVNVLGQLRGNTAFVVIEEGDANKIENVNKAFYTVLFGFFVTPDSASYLYMGLAVTFGFIAIMIITMIVRRSNVVKDAELIRQLAQET